MKNDQMMSLYEYLGRAAGSELGKAVAKAAVKAKVKIDSHYVENSKYKGDILKYPKEFLNEYFGVEAPHTITAAETENDSLPF